MPVAKKVVRKKRESNPLHVPKCNDHEEYMRMSCINMALAMYKERREQGLCTPLEIGCKSILQVANALHSYIRNGSTVLQESGNS